MLGGHPSPEAAWTARSPQSLKQRYPSPRGLRSASWNTVIVEVERHRTWHGGPMQQKHHFALLGGRALPSSKDYLPHMEDGMGLQMVLRVKGLNTRVTHKIVGGDEGSNHAGKRGRPGREKHAQHDPHGYHGEQPSIGFLGAIRHPDLLHIMFRHDAERYVDCKSWHLH